MDWSINLCLVWGVTLAVLLFAAAFSHQLSPSFLPFWHRIKEQDMLLEIAGVAVIGSSLEDAAKLLRSSGNIVK